MAFRPLSFEDYDQYLELINDFRETTFTREQFADTLTKINQSSIIYVYEEKGLLLATGTIIYEHKFLRNTCIYAHIEDVCVRATHRRQGLGKKLMTHLIGAASHCYKITLDCADENVGFYESCGLERRGNQMCQLIENLQV